MSESVATRVMNRAFAADSEAVHAMLCNRVPCNMTLADDPTIVVATSVVSEGQFNVGLVGFINGILDEMGLPLLGSKWSDPKEDGTRTLLGFTDVEKASVQLKPVPESALNP